jgi:CDP-glucose 4,6-dehydratase
MEDMVVTDLFEGIYKNRNVLITGHTGFKGSWLAFWLAQMGANVVGYSLPPNSEPSHFDLLGLRLASVLADIRDQKKLEETFWAFRPEIVFHLAAQPLVRLSYQQPFETFEVNAMGTARVLDACRKTDSVKAIVLITSDKCYENREWVWGYRENDAMGGYDPYSASKGCAELIAGSYRRCFFNIEEYGKSHNILLASCRAGNVIGGGDWSQDRLIPDIIRAIANNEKVRIRSPHATRPWQHLLEPLSGYLLVGRKLLEGKREYAEAWNFGPGDSGSITVEEVVRRVKRIWDRLDYEIPVLEHPHHEANLLKLDCSKAHFKLEWNNVWDISQTLDKTISWYRNFYDANGRLTTAADLYDYICDAQKLKLSWTKSEF